MGVILNTIGNALHDIGYNIGQTIANEASSADAINTFNVEQLEKQREWEKMMSDTAIQRRVEDIKKAGLNPWLAINGGSLGEASTPTSAYQSYDSSAESRANQTKLKLMDNIFKILISLSNSAAQVTSSALGTAGSAGSRVGAALIGG